MCDEFTLADDLARLSRREFAVGGAVALAATSGVASVAAGKPVKEEMVMVTTPDGTADCFFVRPAKGKHPGVILWPDIAGLRDAYKTMARRLAAEGYAVLAVNHYYRAGRAPLLATLPEWRTPAGQEKLKPAIASINAATTVSDAKAFVAWLDRNPAVDTKRKIGNHGHCQTGGWTIRAAAASKRIGAAASFHGGGLVTDKPDSPHRIMAETDARYLIAIAKNDDARAPGDKDALKAAAAEGKRSAEIEVYAGDHGWTVPDSPSYNQAEGDRAHARLLALYSKL